MAAPDCTGSACIQAGGWWTPVWDYRQLMVFYDREEFHLAEAERKGIGVSQLPAMPYFPNRLSGSRTSQVLSSDRFPIRDEDARQRLHRYAEHTGIPIDW